MGVTLALFEVIHYDALLEDAGLMGTVERALLHLAQAFDFQLAESGHPPGLYRLLGHPNPHLRTLVGCPPPCARGSSHGCRRRRPRRCMHACTPSCSE
jgi:hypothetical protein